jgi:hypothetical protein
MCKLFNEEPDRDMIGSSLCQKEVQPCSGARNVKEKVLSLLFVAGIVVIYFPGMSFFRNTILMYQPAQGLCIILAGASIHTEFFQRVPP